MHNGEVPQKSTPRLHGYLFKGCSAGTYSGDICHRALPIKSAKNWRIKVSGCLVHMGLDFKRFLLLSCKSLVRDWGEKRLVSPLCSIYHVQANLCSSLYWKDPCLGIQSLQLWLMTAWEVVSAHLWTTPSWGVGSSQCTEGQDCDSEGPGQAEVMVWQESHKVQECICKSGTLVGIIPCISTGRGTTS